MATGIGYCNEARARIKGRYGTGGEICTCLMSLIKIIGGEFQVRQRNGNHNRSYPKTVLGPVPYPLCPVPGYDVGKVQKLESLELYDFLTLFQYPW